jgi:hypothetical protein
MSILVIIYYGKRKLQYPKSIALKIKSVAGHFPCRTRIKILAMRVIAQTNTI